MRAAQGGVDLDLLSPDAGGKRHPHHPKPRRRTQSRAKTHPPCLKAPGDARGPQRTDPSDADIDRWVANAPSPAPNYAARFAQESRQTAREARPLLRLLAALPGLADRDSRHTRPDGERELVSRSQPDEGGTGGQEPADRRSTALRLTVSPVPPAAKEPRVPWTLHQPLARVACAAPDGVVSTAPSTNSQALAATSG